MRLTSCTLSHAGSSVVSIEFERVYAAAAVPPSATAPLSSMRDTAGARRKITLLAQVNVTGEGTKGGFEPETLERDFEAIAQFSGVVLRGLMTMAPQSSDPEACRPVFRRLRELRDWARGSLYLAGSELSMGMSDDFETGIAEGSTIVRIGRRLFLPPGACSEVPLTSN